MRVVKRLFALAVVAFFCCPAFLFAAYTLVLKNGRRITVQSYREEGGMIKIYSLGGEIGINRDQIRTILKDQEAVRQGMVLPGAETKPLRSSSVEGSRFEEIEKTPNETKKKILSPEESLAREKAKQEREYRKRVEEITKQIKAARNRYGIASGGGGGREPSLLNSAEAIKARTDDLNSRLRDAQHNPGGPSGAGNLNLGTSSSFTGAPPTTTVLHPGKVPPRVNVPAPRYSRKERELSELRKRLLQLEQERERLIGEMKQKKFNTGSLFLE
ncbi:MAG: hypothetical protein ACE5HC_10415 [Candidatus Binatia bacterium]